MEEPRSSSVSQRMTPAVEPSLEQCEPPVLVRSGEGSTFERTEHETEDARTKKPKPEATAVIAVAEDHRIIHD